MNPTMALMLSRAIEEDHRRAAAQRRHRFVEPEIVKRPVAKRERPNIWTLLLHLPRFHPAR
ncbi:MAG: hypothetical protein ABI841_00620 [Chloroflexota bacterium]